MFPLEYKMLCLQPLCRQKKEKPRAVSLLSIEILYIILMYVQDTDCAKENQKSDIRYRFRKKWITPVKITVTSNAVRCGLAAYVY